MDKKLVLTSLRNVVLAGAYIFGISQFMFYGENLFKGVEHTSLMPFMLLLIFVLSVAVVGGLVFGQAVWLFLGNRKLESVKSAIYSVGWLFILTILVVAGLIIFR
ncbi:MAG TPA: hypothetical protein VFL81_00575 [Candidatus Saccharimonadales bacterium]|nr:hypothetical protein [Candidatus Saccharimonadales bacterium]